MLSGRILSLTLLVSLCLMATVVNEAEAQLGRAVRGAVGLLLLAGAVRALSGGGRFRRRRRNRLRGSRRGLFGKRSADEDFDDNDETEMAAQQFRDQEESMFLMASLADEDDCVKFFVCELGSRLDTTLTDFEAYVNDQFASNLGEMDLASGAVEFDLASVVGRTQGAARCESLYSRCKLDYETLLTGMKDQVLGPVEEPPQTLVN